MKQINLDQYLDKRVTACSVCGKEKRNIHHIIENKEVVYICLGCLRQHHNPITKLDTEKLTMAISKAKARSPSDRWKVTKEPFEEELSFLDCKFINDGLDRLVFSFSEGYVIKIEKAKGGQNKTEVENFKKISKTPESIRKYFIPILAYDKENYEWIIMPRAKVRSDGSLEDVEKLESEIEKALSEGNIYVEDIHRNNVGEYKGKPVLVDYGFPIIFKEGTE